MDFERTMAIIAACMLFSVFSSMATQNSLAASDHRWKNTDQEKVSEAKKTNIQLGPRPFFLVDDMSDSALKNKLKSCVNKPSKKTEFSIGHRGAPLQFPEHTKESYLAAARMGAGIIECDVTFTQDRELVCRHSQCDLHTTTNILAVPELAAKCSIPFSPAEIDPITGEIIKPASAQCCTSDITLAEFKMLNGKMDASNPAATTVETYLGGTPAWRTDLYASKGTLLTHRESIELFKQLGVKMTPELKAPSVPMPFQGDFTQQDYAQKLIDEYKVSGIKPEKVFPQSFNLSDVLYWIQNESEFGAQAVYLDGRYDNPAFDPQNSASWTPNMSDLVSQGVKIIAPPMWVLVTVENSRIVPSAYANAAKEAGLGIITWTIERSPPLIANGDWYYQTIDSLVNKDGDQYVLLDVLTKQVGILGIFSDWPATVTYYANCMDIK